MGNTPVSRAFGVMDMYKDDGKLASDVHHIEKSFSHLEHQASVIVDKLDKATDSGDNTITLSRAEVNTLRKFLFLVRTRNEARAQQFEEGRFDEATAALVERFRVRHNLADTKAVWLYSLRHILDSEPWEIADHQKILFLDREVSR